MTAKDSHADPLSGGVEDNHKPSRRSVIKRAGLAGAATAWAIPTVQTLAMSGASAAVGSPPPGGFGTLTGQVTNATDGAPIAGALVSVDSGQSDTTDGSGNYTITDVPSGNHNVTASAPGFIPSTQSTVVPAGGTAVLNFALSAVASGAIRAVLSWGAIPEDLDLHVSGPLSGGGPGRFHVYYAHSQQTDPSGDPYCQLDVDDTDGNGPETQTITVSDSEGNYVAGTYRVWVHNYSTTPEFDVSGATLNLFDTVIQRGSYAQSAATGSDADDIWLVVQFDVDDAGIVSNIVPLQSMTTGNSGSEF